CSSIATTVALATTALLHNYPSTEGLQLLCPSISRHPTTSTLFPHTTLFRSADAEDDRRDTEHSDAAEHPRADVSRHWPYGERDRSEEHTSELQSRENLVCRLLLEKKKQM